MRPTPSLFNRIRARIEELWVEQDAKVIVGLIVLVALAFGGVAVARAVAHASSVGSAKAGSRVVTMRQKVRVRVHGHLLTRWRTRKVYAQAQTLMQTQTIRTPNGTRVVTRPVVRYRVAYRKHVVVVNGKPQTVSQPVTNVATLTSTKTQVVTSTHDVTNTQTVTITQPVTVIATTTVTSTETDSIPVTVTVTVPAVP